MGTYQEKILAIERILLSHPYGITVKEIIGELERKYDIKAERRSTYDCVNILTRFLPIECYKANCKLVYCTNNYYIKSHDEMIKQIKEMSKK